MLLLIGTYIIIIQLHKIKKKTMFENENQCEQKKMVVDKKRISMVIKVVSEL